MSTNVLAEIACPRSLGDSTPRRRTSGRALLQKNNRREFKTRNVRFRCFPNRQPRSIPDCAGGPRAMNGSSVSIARCRSPISENRERPVGPRICPSGLTTFLGLQADAENSVIGPDPLLHEPALIVKPEDVQQVPDHTLAVPRQRARG